MNRTLPSLFVCMLAIGGAKVATAGALPGDGSLQKLFVEWRAFETPPMSNGVPDYTAATFARRHRELPRFLERLEALDTTDWPRGASIDREVLRAEMNGFDFYVRVLRPWERDPAYYVSIWTEQSDTPAHEGPTQHAAIELWQYSFPLSRADQAKLARELRTVAPLLVQARDNLTGNARDLWITGTGTLRNQVADLQALEQRLLGSSRELLAAARVAKHATQEFVAWLEQQAPAKQGPSGIGKEHYTWALRNVHLVPMSWDDEVALLKRELARAHASLALEEDRNRGLPQIEPVRNQAEFLARANASVDHYMEFLRRKQVLPLHDYMDPVLREHLQQYVPEDTRNFFAIATHFEPLTLYTHFYHWWDHAQMRETPHASVVRRGPLLYNIWDSRAEGMATANEELMLHAGLFDHNPRAREIVWIMLAQRAARGLASLYAHANEFTLAQAKAFQVQWTPRGWMRPDLDLLGFEQQLYLRQPGYGTSYVTGKYLIEQLLAERREQLGEQFSTQRFFTEFNAAGMIPVSLIAWELTGVRSSRWL